MPMLVFGLGNPGAEYSETRHNVGFMALDRTAAFFHVTVKKRCFFKYACAKAGDSMLVKPLTYMNSSGKVLHHFSSYGPLIVLCDNMDLPPGKIRIRKGGSSAGQKGLKSIIECGGSEDFIRIYIGTGRPAEGVAVVDHVLSAPQGDEKERMMAGVEKASEALIDLIGGASLEEVERKYN